MAFLSDSVYRIRLDAMREIMRRDELKAIMLFDSDFIQFISNFNIDVEPWERPIVAVVPIDAEPFLILNALSKTHYQIRSKAGTTWISDVTFYSEYPQTGGVTLLNCVEAISSLLQRTNLTTGRIGTDSSSEWGGDIVRIHPQITLVHERQALRDIRRAKTPEELHLCRLGAELADWGQQQYRQAYRPGCLSQEVDYFVAQKLAVEAAHRFPGQQIDFRCGTRAGEASICPHGDGAATGARIDPGWPLINAIVIRVNGLYIENERTYLVEPVTDIQRNIYNVAARATAAGCAAAAAGNPVSAIHAAATQIIADAGLEKHLLHRTGHAMGIRHHDFPTDTGFNESPLRKGEVYSVEPGIYIPGVGGFRIDDTVIVDQEAEIITASDRHIEKMIIS